MSTVFLIARRELGGFLRTWTGYIIVAAVLAILGLAFNAWVLGGGEKRSAEVLDKFFYLASGFVMIASVFLSMRLVAEERQTGTINLLYSSPIKDWEIVVGKYLSGIGFLALMILSTFYMPLLIMVNGKISWGHVFAGYLGLTLLGSASMAIGLFGSSLVRSQVLAAILNGCMTVGLLVAWFLANISERPFSQIFTALALHGIHFRPFQSGMIHTRDVLYYFCVTYFFLFASTRVLEARRWK